MNEMEKEIHLNAMEATARQTFKACCKNDRPDVSVALILLAINDWFEKGLVIGLTEGYTKKSDIVSLPPVPGKL